MNDFWNARYADTDYVYGEEPNEFFKQELLKLKPGKLLLPAEGEGRNAVFAARMGWDVTAFDASIEAKKKAEKLAAKFKVEIHYTVAAFDQFTAEENSFDAIGLTFAHMPFRTKLHRQVMQWLKPGGRVILQGFSKEQIHENSGGPGNIDQLFSEEELKADFSALSELEINYDSTVLNEGKYHQGKARVINLTGVK